MRKHLKLFSILAAALIIISSTTALAAAKAYKLYDINLTVTMPENLYVVTREMTASDPVYDQIDTDSISFTADMEQKNIYLYALSHDKTYDITVNCVKFSEGKDFDKMTGDELNAYLQSERHAAEDSDKVIINEISIKEVGDYSYIYYDMESKDETNKVYTLKSVINFRGYRYVISLQKYDAPIDENIKADFENIYRSSDYTVLNGSSTSRRMMNEAKDLMIGFLMMVAIFAVIFFIAKISRSNKKHHSF